MVEVTLLCKRTVVSSKPVQPGKFHQFSVLDQIMEPNNLQIVYYFRFPSETEPGKTTKKLRESLSELLTAYPIVTGRLQKTAEGQWMIKCNDAGVRTIESSARGSVEEWLQTADREEELKLVYWEEMYHKPYFWSTFYVQITEFEGGGTAIGISCSHLLADVTCTTQLMKAWADTTSFRKMLSPPHFHPLPPQRTGNKAVNHKRYDDLISYYRLFMERASGTVGLGDNKYATVTFAFSDEMVKKCMIEAQAGISSISSMDTNSTPFTALASLFWLSVSKVKGRKEGLIDMSVCLDQRNVLGLDKGFFGNCMVFNKVCGEQLSEFGLANAAEAINNVMDKMSYEGTMDLIEWLESRRNGDEKSAVPINGPDLICANWENLDLYPAMSESFVKPIRVSCYLEPVFGEGQVLILPSPNDTSDGSSLSRVAMVTLPQHEMMKLCDDAFILRFSPTIVMGMAKTRG